MSRSTPHLTPEQVVANIPLDALRTICATDPVLCELSTTLGALKLASGDDEDKENANAKKSQVTTRSKVSAKSKAKELKGREARHRIVLEVERGAVRTLCDSMTKPILVDIVTSLGIDCGEGNNPTSRAVLTKRLTEHIAKAHGGVGIAAFLEKEASEEMLLKMAETLPTVAKPASATPETIQAALEHEALETFFSSLPEEQLHGICVAMKNERQQGETHSRQVLAASIVTNRPVAELVANAKADKAGTGNEKVKQLSKRKPKLHEGVTYEDIFQWYNLAELQDYARDRGIKVSGKKKEVIQRVLAFLSDPDAVKAEAPYARHKKAKPTEKKAAARTPNPASCSFTPDSKLAGLLKDIVRGCKSSQKGLSAKQIDEYEAEQSQTAGFSVRLPDALRQLFMHCNGYSTHYEPPAEHGCGVSVYPLMATPDTPETWLLRRDVALSDAEVWLDTFMQESGKPEDCVASLHWLPFASGGSYQYFFVNVDPATERYGKVYTALVNEGCGEVLFSNSINEFIEKTAKFIKWSDKKRQEILAEDPDIDPDDLDDFVAEEVTFGDDEPDDEAADECERSDEDEEQEDMEDD